MKTHIYHGSCHCQSVNYTIKLNKPLEFCEIISCNCSICDKTGYLHLIIDKDQFELLSDWENIHNYQFNKKVAQHYFCKNCGIKSFYQPRSHPDKWSVNVRCLTDISQLDLKFNSFDGKNWEQNIKEISNQHHE